MTEVVSELKGSEDPGLEAAINRALEKGRPKMNKSISRKLFKGRIKGGKRGYKQCPKCDWLNGMRSKTCKAPNCGYDFNGKGAAKTKTIKIKNPSGRRGFKKCPKCGALVHIRSFMCKLNDCGYMFQKPKETMKGQNTALLTK